MLKKWNVSVLSLLLCVVFVLQGCGIGSQAPKSADSKSAAAETPSPAATNGSEPPVEIEFMHIHAGDVVDKLAEQYNQSQNKVRVKPVFVPGGYQGMIEKIQTLAASKQNMPDVITNGFTYTRFAMDNLPIVPVQTFMDKEHFDTSDYIPSILNLAKGDDGKQYGMPFGVSNPVLWYNADLFRAAGLDPENPPTTWEEVREAAKKLTVNNHFGIFIDYQIDGNWMFQAMTETAGGQMMSKDLKTVGFDSNEGRKALQFWVDLVNTDKSMPNIDSKQASQSFQSGNLAMLVSTSSGLSSIRKNSSIDLKAAKFPTFNGNRKIPAGGNSLMILSKDPKKQAAAWDFVKFATSPKGTTHTAQGFGYMVTRKSALTDPALMGDYLKKDPVAMVSYNQVDSMVPWYNFPGPAGSKIYKIVQDNIQAALLQQKTVDQAIKDAAQQSNDLLK